MRSGGVRPTINDIAERAGVSKATVSFAFNAPAKISVETRDRVLRVADELGYVPDPVARTLATKRIGSIGLLLPQPIQDAFQNPYLFEVLRGIGRLCHAEDLSLTILPPVKGLLSLTVRNAVVDAIVTIGIGPDADILRLIRQRRIPFVTVDGAPAEGVLNVGIDDEAAGYALMRYVLSLGHRELAVLAFTGAQAALSEGISTRTLDLRLAGLERALAEQGSSLRSHGIAVHTCGAAMPAAVETGMAILDRLPRPTACVCLSDAMALGVYAACRQRRVLIPAELSVVGFDDIPFASVASPPLTTVRQPGYEKGYAAASLAIGLLRGKAGYDVKLPAELVVRSSAARPD
jgi:DNA-binding LacI/PurR family transcriptional regulator